MNAPDRIGAGHLSPPAACSPSNTQSNHREWVSTADRDRSKDREARETGRSRFPCSHPFEAALVAGGEVKRLVRWEGAIAVGEGGLGCEARRESWTEDKGKAVKVVKRRVSTEHEEAVSATTPKQSVVNLRRRCGCHGGMISHCWLWRNAIRRVVPNRRSLHRHCHCHQPQQRHLIKLLCASLFFHLVNPRDMIVSSIIKHWILIDQENLETAKLKSNTIPPAGYFHIHTAIDTIPNSEGDLQSHRSRLLHSMVISPFAA